jgi:hypothetical protein
MDKNGTIYTTIFSFFHDGDLRWNALRWSTGL